MSKEKWFIMEKKTKLLKKTILWHVVNTEKELNEMSLDEILPILKDEVEQPNTKDNWGDTLYLAEKDTVAIGYADDTNGKKPYLVELEVISELPCVDSDNEVYKGDDYRKEIDKVPTESIKAQVEILFPEPIGKIPFMRYLGAHEFAYRCFHDIEGNKEIIVPSRMVTSVYFKVKRVYKLVKDSSTHLYGKPGVN